MAGDTLATPTAKKTAAKAFNCPSCGAGVMLRAQGQAISAACRSCGAVIDTRDENYAILSKAAKRLRIDPLIPLGTRGKLHGVLWEVIGFMVRSDGTGVYSWREYLLFNPIRGFRWLQEFDGHWNYITPIKEKPDDHTTSNLLGSSHPGVKYLGRAFHLFHQGSAKVTYVVGEFYWRVKVDEKVRVDDYISPPEILSVERSKDETVWSVGEYVESEGIKEAFQIVKPMPTQYHVAPNQPSSISPLLPIVRSYWGYFLAAVFAIQAMVWMSANNQEVYRGQFTWHRDEPLNSVVTPSFELKQGVSNVAFQLYSSVDNSWLELSVDLVNDKTGAAYAFEQGVEFYSGYTDGYWSEGSRSSEKLLSSVPEGTYHLNIQATGPTVNAWNSNTPPEKDYSVVVIRDVTTWSNFFLALLLLSLGPAFVWWRNLTFERARWSTSDFSPYWLHLGDDDE